MRMLASRSWIKDAIVYYDPTLSMFIRDLEAKNNVALIPRHKFSLKMHGVHGTIIARSCKNVDPKLGVFDILTYGEVQAKTALS